MSFVGSTTAYPVVTPAPTDTVPLVQGGALKQATVTALATAAAPVQSVNGETGAVTLSAADVGADAAGTAAAAVAAHEAASDPHTGYVLESALAESVDDRVAALLVAGSNVSLTYDDGANTLTVASTGAASPTTTKGDLIARSTTADARLAVGSNGQVLTADSAEALGVKWAAAAGGSAGTKTYAVFTPMDSQPPAANFATLYTRNSIATLEFDDTTERSITWVGVMPEGAALGSGLKVRVHWVALTATSGQVRWGAQFERAGTDIDADSYDTAAEAHSTTSSTSGIETVTEITITTIDGIAAGDRYRLRLYRDAGDTTNDTMVGAAECLAVEIRSAA